MTLVEVSVVIMIISIILSAIIDKTPSGCFNLSTTISMGNQNTSGNTSATTSALSPALIPSFNTGAISSSANTTCAFYEMQAFEPNAFGGARTAVNKFFEINSANAIGVGTLNISNSNPAINSYFQDMQTAVSNSPWTVLSLNAGIITCLQQIQSSWTGHSLYEWLTSSEINPLGPSSNFVVAYNTAATNLNTAIKNKISLSIPTATQPQVPSFKTQAMWDLRKVGSMMSLGFYPFELNDTTNLSSWQKSHVLIARNQANKDISISSVDMAGLSSYMAKK